MESAETAGTPASQLSPEDHPVSDEVVRVEVGANASERAFAVVSNNVRPADLVDDMPIFTIRKIGAGGELLLTDETRRLKEPLMDKLRKLEFTIGGGMLAARGFKNNAASRDPLSFGWYGAATVEYHVSQSIFLASGVGIFSRGSLASEQPLFGTNGAYTIKPLTANYLSLPLQFGWRIRARHAFAVGMQFNPLLTVVVAKETTTPGDAGTDRSLILDKSGFNSFDVAGVFSYKASISERWYGNLELQYGLFDVTDNAFFRSGEVNDQNFIGRVGLSYRLNR